MKLPALQFYPGDWRKDPGVQSLTYEERGIWIEILFLMHESDQRGKLLLNGKPISDERLSQLLHLDKQKITSVISTLLELGVASKCGQTGAMMNRRMVRDEEIIQLRRAAGQKGGNPAFQKGKDNPYYKLGTKQKDKQKITPSSSSSSSDNKSKSHSARSNRAADPQSQHFETLAKICGIDWCICTDEQRGALIQSAGIFVKEGKTVEQIKAVGEWWYRVHWKGKQGQAPTPSEVREVWGQALNPGRADLPRKVVIPG